MSLRIATITFSDTRTEQDDESGALLRALLAQEGFVLGPHRIVREDADAMAQAVTELCALSEVAAVVSTGGTGVGPRDQTLSVLEPLFEKPMLGFGETFRRMSVDEIGPRGMLSNAAAGVRGAVVIFALPGSRGAVRTGAGLIASVLPHVARLVSGDTAH